MKIQMKIQYNDDICLIHFENRALAYHFGDFVEVGTYISDFIQYKGRQIDAANIKLWLRLRKCLVIPLTNKTPFGYYDELGYKACYNKSTPPRF